MNSDSPSLEAELRELKSTGLDEDFLTRLEAVADGTWTELSHQEIRFEKQLREVRCAELEPAFLASLEKIVAGLPFDPHAKIVTFPKSPAPSPPSRQRMPWAAAAAVALIGAATALLMPAGKAPPSVTREVASTPSNPVVSPANNRLVPASFNRGLSEVRDEGVIWKSNNQPHTVVRVVYKDQGVFKDAAGRTFHVEQPRTEYMLVPAKTD